MFIRISCFFKYQVKNEMIYHHLLSRWVGSNSLKVSYFPTNLVSCWKNATCFRLDLDQQCTSFKNWRVKRCFGKGPRRTAFQSSRTIWRTKPLPHESSCTFLTSGNSHTRSGLLWESITVNSRLIFSPKVTPGDVILSSKALVGAVKLHVFTMYKC